MEQYTKNHYSDADDIVYMLRKNYVDQIDYHNEELKERLLELYNPLIYHVLKRSQVGCYHEMEDFAQELKMKLIQLVYEWDDTRGVYFSHFVKIMLHTWVLKLNQKSKIYNQRTADVKILDMVQKDYLNSSEKEISKLDLEEYVMELLRDLTPKQAKAVELRYLASLMVNEVADIQDVSAGAVSNLIKRAFKTIRDNMKEDYKDLK